VTTLELTKTTMKMGVWQGIINCPDDQKPQIEVTFQDAPVDDVNVAAHSDDGSWMLSVPVPVSAIADGVQTLLIVDAARKEQIGHITLLAGDVLGDDIRAEMDLLRAELDMLKRAFRRHCLDTA
jgi:hypothetical protein